MATIASRSLATVILYGLPPFLPRARAAAIPAADRQPIARSRGSVLRHRITAPNVRGNRQPPHGQVSVNRSTTCRASASALAR
jgi:hypothetical protein